MIRCEWKGLRETPLLGQGTSPLTRIQIDEQVGTFAHAGPIASRPTQKQMGGIPGHPECHTIGISGL